MRSELEPWDLYNSACIYSLASTKVASSGSEGPPAIEFAREYREQAIKMLRRAIEAGFTDLDHMRKDQDLESIRGHPRFNAILDEENKGDEE